MAKQYSDQQLKKKLTPEQYHILREKGTELPFTGKYLNHHEDGMYACAVCGANLFESRSKETSAIPTLLGWPSFSEVTSSDAVDLRDDYSFGMHRIEVLCKACGSHLGHVFDDDSISSGKHYCINSACLMFEPSDSKKSNKNAKK
ncbi:MAG TPA: peptide-methionine (R)-S-oxide reductase MsrB [Candidatus Saccharimonadales bacterium]|nr:peptide-methionine (R)-S-oxide reductase MsrB [Candidatus Saccharimonadales bacterium]